jgi:uncharacterized protein YndB with AHSA1/START domain
MNNEPFVIERTYNAPTSRVWEAITSKEKMQKWYFDLSDFKPEVGFEFQFAGQGSKGEKYIHLCKIVEVKTGEKLKYSWSYKDYPGLSHVTFELFEEGDNQTKLRLTHEGLETFPQDITDFARASFTAGWTEIIGKLLKEFVEN